MADTGSAGLQGQSERTDTPGREIQAGSTGQGSGELAGRWRRVIFACECEDEYGDGEILICPVCGIDYAECPCPGPHQEDMYEYEEIDGILYAKPIGE